MRNVAGIEFLKEQLVSVESQWKEVQDAISKLPELEAEMQAIKLLLAKHSGGKQQPTLSSHVDLSNGHATATLSVAKLVLKALTEAGKPQSSAQLLTFLASHGKNTNSGTLRSTIYQRDKLFKSVKPGVYALKEWQ